MTKLSLNEIEAANRAEATALLIRAGFRVYRPEADVHGEDLVVRDPAGQLRSVQLKSRPWVDWRRYGDRFVWMLFPEPGFRLGRPWFLIEHDRLFNWFKNRHGFAPKWDGYWVTPTISKDLREFLAPFSETHWAPAGLSTAEIEGQAGVEFIEENGGGRPGRAAAEGRSVAWDDLSVDEQQALECLFTHDSFPVQSTIADRLIELRLAVRIPDGGVSITEAGEDLVVRQSRPG